MGLKYQYVEANMLDLMLDDENPRFASSMLVNNSKNITQEVIIKHLLRHANIKELAKRINVVQELHGSELITCYKRDGKFVVIEGNRRVCACKLLLNRDLIPDEYKASFPIVDEDTKNNIQRIIINVYPDRESVQAYLSDRHIKGVKKWSSIEKQNYYMNLYNQYNDIRKVAEHTSDSISIIKKTIIKYQFFMDVFTVLKSKYADIAIEDIDYLPLVDRFMDTILGNDIDVGLNIDLNESDLKYHYQIEKETIYNKILLLIGEAFLIRKDKKVCADEELCKIVSTEIANAKDQKDLIITDERIPGLYKLIKEYKGIIESNNFDDNPGDNPPKDDKGGEEKDNKSYDEASTDDDDDDIDSDMDEDEAETGNSDNTRFSPNVRYKPKKTPNEYLCFTKDTASKFKINGDTNYELKINNLIYDLASFSVYKHPYACALLYRALLEATAKLIFERYGKSFSRPYMEDKLADNLIFLNDNFLFNNITGKDTHKIRKAIKDNLTTTNIVDILNLYIHYGNEVDVALLLSSWKTMKIFIIICLCK